MLGNTYNYKCIQYIQRTIFLWSNIKDGNIIIYSNCNCTGWYFLKETKYILKFTETNIYNLIQVINLCKVFVNPKKKEIKIKPTYIEIYFMKENLSYLIVYMNRPNSKLNQTLMIKVAISVPLMSVVKLMHKLCHLQQSILIWIWN